jgi:hypothetical protein
MTNAVWNQEFGTDIPSFTIRHSKFGNVFMVGPLFGSAIRCDSLAACEHVAGHRLEQLFSIHARVDRQRAIQGEDLKVVVMGHVPRRRPRPHVTDLAARVAALQRA